MRIKRVAREAPGVFTFDLDVPGFAFQPGQFNMLYVHGIGEVPISISGGDAATLVHTIRAVGTVTRAMDKMKRGDTLGVRGPYGTPWPVEAATGRDVVFVAGGLGLAPLRPAILHVLANRGAYQRVVVLYGARSPEDMLFLSDLERWRGRFDTEVRAIVDRAGRAWRGPVGVVTKLIDDAEIDEDDAVAMVCGPEVMMRFAARALVERGMPRESIYLSMERSMKCGVGLCGHCQWGPGFVCKDGPVYRYDRAERLLLVREV
jgi:NAD(P)H-flavin reductase